MAQSKFFSSGGLFMTAGVADLAAKSPDFAQFVHDSLTRHFRGDWGNVYDEDKALNDHAVDHGLRILSAYNDDRFPKNGIATIWNITEADRSATTILFPDEY